MCGQWPDCDDHGIILSETNLRMSCKTILFFKIVSNKTLKCGGAEKAATKIKIITGFCPELLVELLIFCRKGNGIYPEKTTKAL